MFDRVTMFFRALPFAVLVLLVAASSAMALPDLVISSGPPTVSPTPAVAGDPLLVSPYTIRNQGTTSTGTFRIGFYLSTDAATGPGDIFLGYPTTVPPPSLDLAAGADFTVTPFTFTLPIPASTPPGIYYFGIYADYRKDVTENNEANNYVSTQITLGSPPVPMSYQLSVTINGPGAVVSTPAGIDCSHAAETGTATCSGTFDSGQNVSLSPTPIDGVDFTGAFTTWSGDCTGTGGCSVTMDADRSVTAGFSATPVVTEVLPLPLGQTLFVYDPVELPLKNPTAGLSQPFGVGPMATGVLDLRVALAETEGPSTSISRSIRPLWTRENSFLLRPETFCSRSVRGSCPGRKQQRGISICPSSV